MLKLVVMMLAVAGSTASVSGVEQFNLVCKGVSRTFTGASSEPPEQPWSRTYRVDLKERSYCSGSCAEVKRLAAIEPDKLKFEDNGEGVASVDRISGQLTAVFSPVGERYSANTVSAYCSRAEFSGLPRKF
jgi:hypothetical protein